MIIAVGFIYGEIILSNDDDKEQEVAADRNLR